MEIGTLLKKIRRGKNINQADICDSFISRAALSKIENNKVVPNYRTVCHLLNKLDLSFDEFEYLRSADNLKQEIISNFWYISDVSQQNSLNKIIRLCEVYLADNQDQLISDILLLSQSLLKLPNLSIEEINYDEINELTPIWKRLNKMDLWTLNELKLASYSLFYFSLETSLHIASRIEKELQKYESLETVQIFILNTYINLTTLYMQHENWQLVSQLNEKSLVMAKKINRYDHYYICYVRKGIYEQDVAAINFGLEMLEHFGKAHYVKDLKEEVDQYYSDLAIVSLK